jgi:hypothetical protein
MLHLIKSHTDAFFKLLEDDPVRPNIPHISRVGVNRDIFVLSDEFNVPRAITCVSYLKDIPRNEGDLFNPENETTTAVFYTIWSYSAGAGRQLIFDSVEFIKQNKKDITQFVTLSPKTEMAKRFHIKNGAIVFRENEETVNYQYLPG